MYRIKYLGNLTKEINVPPDKSISHRAAIISSLCKGKTLIKPFLHSEDTLATVDCLEKLGVKTSEKDDSFTVDGVGMYFSRREKVDLYARESGTTMRMLSGVLVAQKFPVEFRAAESLNKRPMDRIVNPLSQMGAAIEGQKQSNSLLNTETIISPPLSILGPCEYSLTSRSKSSPALILSRTCRAIFLVSSRFLSARGFSKSILNLTISGVLKSSIWPL